MKGSKSASGYDMYFRGSPKKHKKDSGKKHQTAARHKHTRAVRVFDIPDEQMSEPPVVPVDRHREWS